jgi:hypothetical protein
LSYNFSKSDLNVVKDKVGHLNEAHEPIVAKISLVTNSYGFVIDFDQDMKFPKDLIE